MVVVDKVDDGGYYVEAKVMDDGSILVNANDGFSSGALLSVNDALLLMSTLALCINQCLSLRLEKEGGDGDDNQ